MRRSFKLAALALALAIAAVPWSDQQVLAASESGSAEAFRSVGNLGTARTNAYYASALLSTGEVLVVGGELLGPHTAELYDPDDESFTPIVDLPGISLRVSVAPLPNGRAIAVAGSTAAVFDVNTMQFTSVSKNHYQDFPTPTVLADGRVLFSGGRGSNPSVYLDVAEVFDPDTDTFTSVGPLQQGRDAHTATLLRDGRVLLAGGAASPGVGGSIDTAELFDPTTESFTIVTAPMNHKRQLFQSVLLPDGEVLLIGGWDESLTIRREAEIYDPVAQTFTPTGSMADRRISFQARLISDDEVLAIGGTTKLTDGSCAGQCFDIAESEVYDIATGTFSAGPSLTSPRDGFDAEVLDDGSVLVVAGRTDGSALDTAEIYERPRVWSDALPLPEPRSGLGMAATDDFIYVVGDRFGVATVAWAPVAAAASGTVADWSTAPGLDVPEAPWGSYQAQILGDWLYVYAWQQPGDNSAQGLFRYRIDASGSLSDVQTLADPTLSHQESAFVSASNYLYLVGGASNTTEYASIDVADGSVGAWSPTNSPLVGRRSAAAVSDGNSLYVIAGNTGGSGAAALTSVESAPINAIDGSLGTWSATSSLNVGASTDLSAAVFGDRVFVGGGNRLPVGPQFGPGDGIAVQSARFLGGGHLSDWRDEADLPIDRLDGAMVNAGGEIYFAGGINLVDFAKSDSGFVLGDASSSEPEPPFEILGWEPAQPLPVGLHGHGVATFGRWMFVAGGSTETCPPPPGSLSFICRDIWVTDLDGVATGDASDWELFEDAVPLLPSGRNGAVKAGIIGDWLFLYVERTGEAQLYRYPITDQGSEAPELGAPVPVDGPAGIHQAGEFLAVGDYLYSFGGFSQSATEFTKVDPVTGAVLGWVNTGTFVTIKSGGSASDGEHIYLAGGNTGGTGAAPLTDVLRAKILSEGELGPWMTASESLAIGRSLDPVVIIVDGQLIVSGGDTQTVGATVVRTDTIERASIVANPAVDEEFLVPFVFDAPLPAVSRDHVTIEVDGRIYLTGGTGVGPPTPAAGFLSAPLTPPDTTAPDAPSVPNLVALSDSGASDSDDVTNDATPTLVGTAEVDSVVRLFDGAVEVGSAVAVGGSWSITASVLADGVRSLTATATDAAENESVASGALLVLIDTVAPDVPSVPDLVASSDSGVSDSDDVTNEATPTLVGTAETDSVVRLFDGAIEVGSAVAVGGSWLITLSVLADGDHSLAATATDAAGNESGASTALTVRVDTVVPDAPSVPDLAAVSDTGASDSDDLTSDSTPTIVGTAEVDAVVRLFDGPLEVGSAAAVGGSWSIIATVLADGVHSVTATATDAAGNESVASPALDVHIDTTAPDVPSVPDLVASSDSGPSDSDDVTNDATPTLAGTADADTVVRLFDGAVDVGSTVAVGGAWSITTSVLADGDRSLVATATDAAGNESLASGALVVRIDTTAPDAPSVPDLVVSSDSGASDSDDVTNDATPTLVGAAEADAIVRLLDGAVEVGATVAVGGGWSITTSVLADGVHSLAATATDAAGNESVASGALAVRIDTVAPVVTAPSPNTLEVTTLDPGGVPASNVQVAAFLGEASALDDQDGDVPATFPGSFDVGVTAFDLEASDLAGNVGDAPATITVNLASPGSVDIDPDAVIGPGVTIEPDATIEGGAVIGAGSFIGFNAKIEEDAQVGAGSIIGAEAQIKKNAVVGDRVTIGPRTTVEEDAVIGDGTVIGEDVKIEEHVEIGTDVTIGDDAEIKKNAVIGDRAAIGAGVTIEEDVNVPQDAVIP